MDSYQYFVIAGYLIIAVALIIYLMVIERLKMFRKTAGPHLNANIYIKGLNNKNVILIHKNSPVPTKWKATLSTIKDNQATIDLHLLYGSSNDTSELGYWQIYDIPPSKKGKLAINFSINISSDGSVDIKAQMNKQPLKVRLLEGAPGKIPIEN